MKKRALCIPGIRLKLRARDHVIGVNDVLPLCGTLKSSAPALMKSKTAVELGALKKSRQQLGLPLLEIHTLEKPGCTSYSPPPLDALLAARDTAAFGLGVPAFPAPATVFGGGLIELGGLKQSPSAKDQSLAIPSNVNARTIEHTPPPLSSFPIIPSAFHSALASNGFAPVSAILRTCKISHLAWTLGEEQALWSVWEREGIGTRTGF
ncbi:hypothetical protein B0H17DRAFT_1134245 [Mycena rosella]|uniref:Uncharacterized protein n=1 Tax=Mycena rosella TaxID=1033263 RepID=A0AAD7DG20_MYCRO|nr:hypothetical protein B0H17DRAFT_1134245 [Mycena rosella]